MAVHEHLLSLISTLIDFVTNKNYNGPSFQPGKDHDVSCNGFACCASSSVLWLLELDILLPEVFSDSNEHCQPVFEFLS